MHLSPASLSRLHALAARATDGTFSATAAITAKDARKAYVTNPRIGQHVATDKIKRARALKKRGALVRAVAAVPRAKGQPSQIFERPTPAVLRFVENFADRVFQFDRRTPAIHRVIDAAKENVRRPDLPGEQQAKTVARVLKDSPAARAAALRLAKVGVGAGVGGVLGYRARGRKGIKPGMKAGALAGLLFSTPEARNAVRAGVMFAAKLKFS